MTSQLCFRIYIRSAGGRREAVRQVPARPDTARDPCLWPRLHGRPRVRCDRCFSPARSICGRLRRLNCDPWVPSHTHRRPPASAISQQTRLAHLPNKVKNISARHALAACGSFVCKPRSWQFGPRYSPPRALPAPQSGAGAAHIAVTVRYSHLAPSHQREAIERLTVGPTSTATSTKPLDDPWSGKKNWSKSNEMLVLEGGVEPPRCLRSARF